MMDFHDFPMFLGKSGVDLFHPPSYVRAYSHLAAAEVYGFGVEAEFPQLIERMIACDIGPTWPTGGDGHPPSSTQAFWVTERALALAVTIPVSRYSNSSSTCSAGKFWLYHCL